MVGEPAGSHRHMPVPVCVKKKAAFCSETDGQALLSVSELSHTWNFFFCFGSAVGTCRQILESWDNSVELCPSPGPQSPTGWKRHVFWGCLPPYQVHRRFLPGFRQSVITVAGWLNYISQHSQCFPWVVRFLFCILNSLKLCALWKQIKMSHLFDILPGVVV